MAFPGSVTAKVETPDTPGSGDFNDDPAILVHPTDPTKSVVLTANKDFNGSTVGGIYAYDLSGSRVESEGVGSAFNNVDVEYNFGRVAPFSGEFSGEFGGDPVFDNIIGATGRESGDIHFWTYDFANGSDEMRPIGTIDTGYSDEPYGFTLGRIGETYYAFSSADNGSSVEQWELSESGGSVSGKIVRKLPTNGQVEGIVVDDESGFVYIAEELGAIKKYGADPASGTAHTVIDKVGSGGHLVADIEGLAIYYGPEGSGYLIASSQGEDKYAVYDRGGSNAYIGEFSVGPNGSGIDGTSSTDGLDVSNVNFGGQFSEGLLVVHDNSNSGADSSNFKFVGWGDVARLGGLKIDTSHDPRARVSGEPTQPTDPTDPTDPTEPTDPPGTTPPAYFTIDTTDAPVRTYTGTSANNTMNGTDVAEKFDGKGGSDIYRGQRGDDFYVIAQPGDRIESETGGQDTVEYWGNIDYVLPANIEHAIVQGSTNRTVTGNADNNIMTAAGTTSGTMTFIGGTGDDNIRVGTRDVAATGGADNDLFRYSTNAATGTGNTIADFTWGDDLIDASPLVTGSYAPTVNPFTNGVLSLVDSGSDVKLMWDQDGSSNSTVAAVEVVTLLGVQIDNGINEDHIYTGL